MFAITGFAELGEGRLEAIYVAEERAGELVPAGQVPVRLRRQGPLARARRAARWPAEPQGLRRGAA